MYFGSYIIIGDSYWLPPFWLKKNPVQDVKKHIDCNVNVGIIADYTGSVT